MVAFDTDTARDWLRTEDLELFGQPRAARYRGATGLARDEVEHLVEEASRAGLFGPHLRVALWLDHDPIRPRDRPGLAHHYREITPPAPLPSATALLSPSYAPHGPVELDAPLAVLDVAARDVDDVLRRSRALLTPPSSRPGWARDREPSRGARSPPAARRGAIPRCGDAPPQSCMPRYSVTA